MAETWFFDRNEKTVNWDEVLSTGRTDRDIMTYTGEPSAYRKVWGTLNRFANSVVSATAVQRMKDQQSPNPLPRYRPSQSSNVSGPTNADLARQVQALVGALANVSSADVVKSIRDQQALEAQDRADIHTQLNTLAEDIAAMPGPPDLSLYAKAADMPKVPDMSKYAKTSDLTAINESISALNSKAVQQDFQVITTTQGLSLTANTIDLGITWKTPFPDTNYAVLMGLSVSSVSLLGKFAVNLKQNSKSKTGCTLTLSGGGIVVAAGQTIEVLAYRYGT